MKKIIQREAKTKSAQRIFTEDKVFRKKLVSVHSLVTEVFTLEMIWPVYIYQSTNLLLRKYL